MNKLVSFCTLFLIFILQSCGPKSEPSAIMSLYQSEHPFKVDSTKNDISNNEIQDDLSKTTIKYEINWLQTWNDKEVKSFKIERIFSFKLPDKIASKTREAFPGIIALEVFRPNSETSLPKHLKCIYRQQNNDRDFEFQFCTEYSAAISMEKLERIEASAMNLIDRDQREDITFDLKEFDQITTYFAFPQNLSGKQGKTKNSYKAEIELQFLK